MGRLTEGKAARYLNMSIGALRQTGIPNVDRTYLKEDLDEFVVEHKLPLGNGYNNIAVLLPPKEGVESYETLEEALQSINRMTRIIFLPSDMCKAVWDNLKDSTTFVVGIGREVDQCHMTFSGWDEGYIEAMRIFHGRSEED